MQALCFEVNAGLRLTLAHSLVCSTAGAYWLFTRGNFDQLLEKFLVVTLNFGLLHRLFVLVNPLLVPEEPLLVILTELGLPLGLSADIFARSNVG